MADALAPRMPRRLPRTGRPRAVGRRWSLMHSFLTRCLLLQNTARPSRCPAHRPLGGARSPAMADAFAPRMPGRLPRTGRPCAAGRRWSPMHPLLTRHRSTTPLYCADRASRAPCSTANAARSSNARWPADPPRPWAAPRSARATDARAGSVARAPPSTGAASKRRRSATWARSTRVLVRSPLDPPRC